MHRDWTHASDVAAALDGLLFAPKLKHRIYNVSAGESMSAREIIALFVERGLKVCLTPDARQADIVLDERDSRRPLAIERLRQDTGFVPRFNILSGIDALL
jgi:nucleoside-diphosphate-sugar epimerase